MKIKTHYLRDNDQISACGEMGASYNDIRMVNCEACRARVPDPSIGYFRKVAEKHKVDFTEEKYHENHYQKELRDWIIDGVVNSASPPSVIETGIYWGVSTDRILQALDTVGGGFLYSIDPDPRVAIVKHPRWMPILKKSEVALPEIMEFHDPHTFDIFLHDSDHGYECQTFEYEYALNHLVREGGYILTDDPWWGDPCHYAWDKFKERNKEFVKEIPKIGHACHGVQIVKLPNG